MYYGSHIATPDVYLLVHRYSFQYTYLSLCLCKNRLACINTCGAIFFDRCIAMETTESLFCLTQEECRAVTTVLEGTPNLKHTLVVLLARLQEHLAPQVSFQEIHASPRQDCCQQDLQGLTISLFNLHLT